MARGHYKVPFFKSGYSASGPSALMVAQCAIGKLVELLEVHVTDADQITNQQLECQIQQCSAVGGLTGGVPVTPVPDELGDQAAASTWTSFLTTNTVTPASTPVGEGWPIQGGFHWTGSIFVPAIAGPGSSFAGLAIVLVPTPASFRVSGWACFREMG